MAIPKNKEEFKDYCLRELGHPVIEINVDDDQVDDRIDQALQYFQDFHFDGVERWYLSHQLTAEDIERKYIKIPDNIIGVTRIFPLSSSTVRNMFDLQYQIRLNDLTLLTTGSIVYFTQMQQHLRLLDMTFNGEPPIRFNRHTGKLYLDLNWSNVKVDQWIVIEGYIIVDPEKYEDVWNDRMLKRYATALIKKQWGSNMKKFGGMQLPGGIMMNGQQIHDEAVLEIKEIEDLIRSSYEEPPMMQIG
jgi:hypothetical protein